MPLKLTAADKTDVGKQREQNEDSVYKRIETSSDGDRGLFIVADGMGGYQAGEVASRLAVETISKAINDIHFFQPIQDQTTIKLTQPPTPVDPDATVKMTPVSPMEQSEKLQQTVKLPETPIAKRIEDQFTRAIQEANTAIVKYGERKTPRVDWAVRSLPSSSIMIRRTSPMWGIAGHISCVRASSSQSPRIIRWWHAW